MDVAKSRTCAPRVDRWLGLSTSTLILACGGLTYTYAVYSGHLQAVLHYTQEQTDDVAAARDWGYLVGLVSGLFYSFYPPWVTVSIGAILHLFGYSMVWMTLTGVVKPSFWLLCTYFILGVGGDSFIDTGCITTTLESFGDYRGTAMGILKAQVGLSGAIFVLVYEAFMEMDENQFVLLVALVPSVAAFLLAYFTRPFPPEYQDDDGEDVKQRFHLTYGLLICLGIFLMVVIIIKAFLHPGRDILKFYLTIILTLASATFIIPLIRRPVDFFAAYMDEGDAAEDATSVVGRDLARRESLYRKKPFRPQLQDIHEDHELAALQTATTPATSGDGTDGDGTDGDGTDGDGDERESLVFSNNDAGEKQLLQQSCLTPPLLRLDFWLVMAVLMIGGGTGLAVINDFAQIGQSLGDHQVKAFMGLISVWSCFGCLLGGYGSDFLIKMGKPRPLGLLMAQLLMSSCCLLLATGWVPFLYVGSCMVGLAYGSHWSLQPPILAEVFGLQQFPTLYKISSTAAPVGAYLLSTNLAGMLYGKQAAFYKGHPWDLGAKNACMGSMCFSLLLLMLALLCIASATVSFWFTMRTRPFYHQPQASSPSPRHAHPFLIL